MDRTASIEAVEAPLHRTQPHDLVPIYQVRGYLAISNFLHTNLHQGQFIGPLSWRTDLRDESYRRKCTSVSPDAVTRDLSSHLYHDIIDVLDGAMVVLAMYILNILHPARLLNAIQDYPDSIPLTSPK